MIDDSETSEGAKTRQQGEGQKTTNTVQVVRESCINYQIKKSWKKRSGEGGHREPLVISKRKPKKTKKKERLDSKPLSPPAGVKPERVTTRNKTKRENFLKKKQRRSPGPPPEEKTKNTTRMTGGKK